MYLHFPDATSLQSIFYGLVVVALILVFELVKQRETLAQAIKNIWPYFLGIFGYGLLEAVGFDSLVALIITLAILFLYRYVSDFIRNVRNNKKRQNPPQ